MKPMTLERLRKKDIKLYEYFLWCKNKTGCTFKEFKKFMCLK